MTTHLLSASLKSELKFLSLLEKGKFHTQYLNFKDWTFGLIVTRDFRPKSGHLNERVSFKPINEISKCHLLFTLG